jgi:hypothetical protein
MQTIDIAGRADRAGMIYNLVLSIFDSDVAVPDGDGAKNPAD